MNKSVPIRFVKKRHAKDMAMQRQIMLRQITVYPALLQFPVKRNILSEFILSPNRMADQHGRACACGLQDFSIKMGDVRVEFTGKNHTDFIITLPDLISVRGKADHILKRRRPGQNISQPVPFQDLRGLPKEFRPLLIRGRWLTF